MHASDIIIVRSVYHIGDQGDGIWTKALALMQWVKYSRQVWRGVRLAAVETSISIERFFLLFRPLCQVIFSTSELSTCMMHAVHVHRNAKCNNVCDESLRTSQVHSYSATIDNSSIWNWRPCPCPLKRERSEWGCGWSVQLRKERFNEGRIYS